MINARNFIYGLLAVLLFHAGTGGAQTVSKIAAGYYHSLLIKNNGSLWVMGANGYGQLGDGSFNNTNRPEQIVATNVTAIAAGDSHSLFLQSDGRLWVMGANGSGQLGDGSFNNTNRPEQIVATNVIAIAAGSNHSLFLKSDGSLWGMGLNASGQLGNGSLNNTNRPVQIVTTNVTAIAAGDSHSLFLKSDGSLWAMGWNFYGQLGDGTLNNYTNLPEQIIATNVTKIAAGSFHSLFLKNDGSLWVMGNNWFGQLGDGTPSVFGNQTNIPEKIVTSGAVAISAGQYHSLLIKSDGSLWSTGANSAGQLGTGAFDQTNRFEQILPTSNPASNLVSIRLLNDGRVSLSYGGIAGSNYALDRTFNLAPVNWVPQATNPADTAGLLLLTNTPVKTTNNFWRIRSVP